MADPFVAEIRMFPFNFAPRDWAWCDGTLIPLSQNTALFALLGTTYGGNGSSNFGLPDMRGRAPMHAGQGPDLSQRDLGESGGSEAVSLAENQLPAHDHAASASGRLADNQNPGAAALATGSTIYTSPTGLAEMAPDSLSATGGNAPHNNMQPYLTCNFCIAMQGIFPPTPRTREQPA